MILEGLVPSAAAQSPVTALTPPPACVGIFTTGMGDGFMCAASYIAMLTYAFIGFGASLALILLIVNGIRYMTGPAMPGGSSDQAKQGIQNAIVGLGVALLSYIILDTFIAAITQ